MGNVNRLIPTYTVLDFETSGVSSTGKVANSSVVAITQIAAVVVDGYDFNELARYDSYIIPYDSKLEYQEQAAKITGIDRQLCFDKGKDIKTAFKEFNAIVREHNHNIQLSNVVGQNIQFDIDFLIDGYRRSGLDIMKTFKSQMMGAMPIPKHIDTLDLGKLDSSDEKSYNMGALCEYYNIDYVDGHDAMNDVLITLELFKAQIQKIRNSAVGEKEEMTRVREVFEF